MNKACRAIETVSLTKISSSLSSVNFIPTLAIHDHGSNLEVYAYKRIKVESLNVLEMKRLWHLVGSSQEIATMESPKFILIQYPGKPIVAIGKEDGHLYSFEDGTPLREREKQCAFVLEILKRFNLVEDVHSHRIGGNPENKETHKKSDNMTFISKKTQLKGR